MKDTLVKRFVIGTFVSLYALVSVISTIHVIDFFELSNPYWLAVTLAIGFEVGAAASLASLVILKKMNKTIVWSLFIAITLMQMQGNMFYAYINLEDFSSWSELFNIIEEEPIYQKRILAFVSGAILPLIALGFIKSLVDYIKPDEDEEQLTSGSMDDDMLMSNDFETKPSDEFFEDMTSDDFDLNRLNDLADQLATQPEAEIVKNEVSKEERERLLTEIMQKDQELGLYDDWDVTLADGLEDEPETQLGPGYIGDTTFETEWDEDHALDQVMNDMVKDFTEEDITTVLNDIHENEEPVNPTSVGSIVEKLATPHLPENQVVVKTQEQLWNEAMEKKAKEDMDAFLKNKNANK